MIFYQYFLFFGLPNTHSLEFFFAEILPYITILGTVVDLEPLHNHVHATSTNINSTGLNSNQDQIENAVIKQELMASKEEIADLKAKIYVSDKEKTGKITLFYKYQLTRKNYMIAISNSKELFNSHMYLDENM